MKHKHTPPGTMILWPGEEHGLFPGELIIGYDSKGHVLMLCKGQIRYHFWACADIDYMTRRLIENPALRIIFT